MSEDLVTVTQRRVEEVLGRVDRQLREGAVRRAVYRSLVLTDGQVVGDPNLAAALARSAAHTLLTAKSSLPNSERPPDSRENQAALAAQQNLAREQACVAQADRVDTALVALRAAQQLLDRSRLAREDLGVVQPLLEVADELAMPGRHALVREAALGLMAATLRQVSPAERAPLLGVDGLRRLRQHALGNTASRHVQCAGWQPLALVLGAEIEKEFLELFAQSRGPDAALLRHQALLLLPTCPLSPEVAYQLVWAQRQDPSEHVRQGVVLALHQLAEKAPLRHADLSRFALQDGCPRIVALTALKLAEATVAQRSEAHRALLTVLEHCCRSEERSLHRAALACVRTITESSSRLPLLGDASQALQTLINGPTLDSAELAATLARSLAVEAVPAAKGLLVELQRLCRQHPEGKTFSLTVASHLSEQDVLQVAFVASACDLPLQLRQRSAHRYTVCRGEKRGFRLWRFFYELKHFGPDKRQSYLHSHGRLPHLGASTVPIRQAEVTPTRVPGERRAIVGQSWGCFLPRVDDLLAACRCRNGKRLATPFGVLLIAAPQSWLHRLWLRATMVSQHARLCTLRDQSLAASQPETQASFSLKLRQLGFRVSMEDTSLSQGRLQISTSCPAATPYFQALPLSWVLWFEDALQYVVSPSGNTAWHLALVVWFVLIAMLLRSGRVQQRFAQSKRKIALSVGGWGSRGKSGTERLKSALFQSLHLDVVSKTTGCEAMLILARRGQEAQELFLYRPYDKATIWEQEVSVGYAQQLGAQVFLWECMALNPEFVDILNREWMQDTITTITNAYPDHEDIMGPSGEDVARTIARFVPQQGTVLSSEDQMQALVRESAQRSRSELIDVEELAADLLPRDLLDRFPYQEHPRNIALTLRLAETLGLDAQRTLYDLADNVVPDLGVLKTFPLLNYKTRTFIFSNGMSANERAGFLSNWQRLGFATHDCDQTPKTQTIVVLNNRADRVARSRVFAELCARDISVDKMVIIGTNGLGMRGFLQKAVVAESLKLTLPKPIESRLPWLDEIFKRLSGPRSLATVEKRMHCLATHCGHTELPEAGQELLVQLQAVQNAAQLPGNPSAKQPTTLNEWEATARIWLQPLSESLSQSDESGDATWQATATGRQEQLLGWLMDIVCPWLLYRHCIAAFSGTEAHCQAASDMELIGLAREAFCTLFSRKMVVLEDSEAKGDAVLDFVFRQLAPGLHGKVLGCQNIKGTGLDFIYRFMSLQKVSDWLDQLEHSPSEREQVLEQLRTHPGLGLFDCQLLISRTEAWLASDSANFESIRTPLQELRSHWLARRTQLMTDLGSRRKQARWLTMVGWLEPLVDNLDAIGRRKRADGIMKRLILGHIDVSTASEALREVVARQKGGWLARDLEGYWQRLRPTKKATALNG